MEAIHQELKAIFFDMDGVLIDSEPYWQQAEKAVFSKLFSIQLSDQDIHSSTGLKTTEVVSMHSTTYHLESIDIEKIAHDIEKIVIELVYKHGRAKEGLYELIEYIKKRQIPAYLVTSSSHYVLTNIVSFLGLDSFFVHKFSAYDEAFGKPNPAVYLSAIKYCQLSKSEILVIEDSTAGVTAAHRSGLNVWALPETISPLKPAYSLASRVFRSHNGILASLQNLYE